MGIAESVGIDRRTGKVLIGWDHVVQSVEVIFTTPFYARVMRPYVGSFVPRTIGELANPRTAQRFRWATAMGLMLFEPRLYPVRIDQVGLDRTGATDWYIEGAYRPRAHKGDLTVAGIRTLTLRSSDGTLVVSADT